MVRSTALIAALVMAAVSPAAGESDVPMRVAGNPISTSRTLLELQACFVREIARGGKAVDVPIEHGVEIDEVTQTLLTKAHDARLRIRVEDLGDTRRITAFYRHPYTARYVAGRMKGFAKRCSISEIAEKMH